MSAVQEETEKKLIKNKGREMNSKKAEARISRVHVSYPNAMKERLEEIRVETDKGTLSEVFRQALLFYALAYEEHKKGNDFLIRNRNGEIERLRMFL